MIVAVIALALVVVVLAHKSDPANAPTGAASSNGETVTTSQPMSSSPGPNVNGTPYGATGTPSPFTGVGLPGSATGFKTLLYMQNPPGGPGARYNAFVSSPKIKGTGLLDPLPAGRGTMSKQLLTKDVLPQYRPGRKI